jgi:hypothetical protein
MKHPASALPLRLGTTGIKSFVVLALGAVRLSLCRTPTRAYLSLCPAAGLPNPG